MRFSKEFYLDNAVSLAKKLLGQYIVRRIDGKEIIVKIVETEAYVGPEDKGCHAYNNRRTKRTESMFLEGGYAYVYIIYGMYYCLNIVTAKEDKPEAVLIRAVEPISGLEYIKENRKIKSTKIEELTNGPGKLCKALNINKSLDKYNLVTGEELFVMKNENIEKEKVVEKIAESKRINIDYAEEYTEKLWRFYIKGNKFVSKNKVKN
ncbi:DNA-3-methyladenine glycosylase [Haliovirga abyssi]|uniref:Putative 3-methyladenine DNA glycosylase n=1 Tax=Haliovirga abyssi TaxID=2996794 RepID=A0AAU9DCA3_9FUSO|nr:DNA-3-methyladenine glycosylase [Haliovirga abyssi]BDU49922.1 putative 3-methyladenine DNA glycosylase [Haliovirga abyssi]